MKNQPYIYYQDELVTLWCGDVRDVLPLLLIGPLFDLTVAADGVE